MKNIGGHEELKRFVGDSNYLFNFGYSKVTVLIELESKMNYDKIFFSYRDLELNYCYEVFNYNFNSTSLEFSYSECARVTGISYHNVKRIYDKYLK